MLFNTEQEAIQALEQSGCDEFDGMNCNDYTEDSDELCTGWDGESSRCACGNRRIQILTNQDSDGKWYAYASAY